MNLSLVYFVLFIPVLILVGILSLISYIFRSAVGILLAFKHGKKIKFLRGLDAIFLYDDGKIKPYIQFAYKNQGEFDIDSLLNRVLTELNSNKRNYANFLNYFDSYCGYFYWREEKNFRIEDHIVQPDCNPPSDDNELDLLCAKLMKEHHQPPGRSPWTIYVVPLAKNFRGISSQPHHVIILSYHHTLSDAMGGYLFFDKAVCQSQFDFQKLFPPEKEKSFVKKFLKQINLLLEIISRTPYWISTQLFIRDKALVKTSKLGVQFLRKSTQVPLSRIKKIKNATEVTVNDVLMSCLVAGIRKHFLREKIPLSGKVNFVIPVSLRTPKQPTLENHIGTCVFECPLDSISPLGRLKVGANRLKILKSQMNSVVSFFWMNFTINFFPKFFSTLYVNNAVVSAFTTNVALPSNSNWKEISPRTTFYATIGESFGLGFILFSQNDQITFISVADSSVISNPKEIEQILRDSVEEVDLLEQSLNKEL